MKAVDGIIVVKSRGIAGTLWLKGLLKNKFRFIFFWILKKNSVLQNTVVPVLETVWLSYFFKIFEGMYRQVNL